jgi:hypothetical protein
MVPFIQVSQPKPSMYHSCLPFMPHAQPMSFFLVWSPKKYLVERKVHNPPLPWYLVPFRPQYPQPKFLPQCERPSFTLIQNNRKNYSSLYFNLYIFELQTRRQKILHQITASTLVILIHALIDNTSTSHFCYVQDLKEHSKCHISSNTSMMQSYVLELLTGTAT